MVYQRAYMPNKAQGVILGENRVTGITPKTVIYSNKKCVPQIRLSRALNARLLMRPTWASYKKNHNFL